jgi:hypothetical protein
MDRRTTVAARSSRQPSCQLTLCPQLQETTGSKCSSSSTSAKTGYSIRSYIRAVLINRKDSRTVGLMQIKQVQRTFYALRFVL